MGKSSITMECPQSSFDREGGGGREGCLPFPFPRLQPADSAEFLNYPEHFERCHVVTQNVLQNAHTLYVFIFLAL